jgi:xylono-1,5-lactonase
MIGTTAMKLAVDVIWDAKAQLGEGPLWCESTGAIYWVDILHQKLMRTDSSGADRQTWDFNHPICSIVERVSGGFSVTTKSDFAYFDETSGQVSTICTPTSGASDIRFNDGKCDAAGRFWAGTMHIPANKPLASLFKLDHDLKPKLMDSGYVVTNGPTWSPDSKFMYHNETSSGQIFIFDFDLDSGEIRNKRLFRQFKTNEGLPDGMCVDSAGCIWVAHFSGARVTRFAPDGRELQCIELPTSMVTSCAFGGHDFRTLFITTATVALNPKQLEEQPLAGALFAVQVDTPGFASFRFKG